MCVEDPLKHCRTCSCNEQAYRSLEASMGILECGVQRKNGEGDEFHPVPEFRCHDNRHRFNLNSGACIHCGIDHAAWTELKRCCDELHAR